MRAAFAVDRVSIARLDAQGAHFEIVVDAGADLLAPGTMLPVSTCSYFVAAAEDREFCDADFDASDEFARPLDGVVLASGFHAGCSVPIHRDGRAVGAVSLSTGARGADLRGATADLAVVADVFGERLRDGPGAQAGPVLVCHADPLAGRGIARLIERGGSGRAIVAGTLESALAGTAEAPPEVVICDDWVDGLRVDEVARQLRAAGIHAPLLVVSSRNTPENLRASLLAGATAHISRHDVVRALPVALAAVRGGGTMLPAPGPDDTPHLTQREHELLEVLDEGLRFKQVAVRLQISEATAKTHARNLFRKLDATSRTEALHAARRLGLLA